MISQSYDILSLSETGPRIAVPVMAVMATCPVELQRVNLVCSLYSLPISSWWDQQDGDSIANLFHVPHPHVTVDREHGPAHQLGQVLDHQDGMLSYLQEDGTVWQDATSWGMMGDDIDTKLQLFCKHFQLLFLQWKLLYFV